MNLRTSQLSLLGSATLSLLLACGGGGGGGSTSTPPPVVYATTLAYTDPGPGSFQLKKNTGLSTPTRLVLDLVAVNAGNGAGVAVHLSTDGLRAAWSKVADGDPEFVRNGSVFTLGTGTPALKGKVNGNTLQFVVSQKGLAGSPVLNGTLATVALSLKSSVMPGPVSLDVVSGKAQVLLATGNTPVLALEKGTINAQ